MITTSRYLIKSSIINISQSSSGLGLLERQTNGTLNNCLIKLSIYHRAPQDLDCWPVGLLDYCTVGLLLSYCLIKSSITNKSQSSSGLGLLDCWSVGLLKIIYSNIFQNTNTKQKKSSRSLGLGLLDYWTVKNSNISKEQSQSSIGLGLLDCWTIEYSNTSKTILELYKAWTVGLLDY